MTTRTKSQSSPPPAVRCAIYTRKSTEEGLDQAFNSLDAQRDAAEAYIKSQAHEGWTALPDRYDDGGFTGGTMDRPALARLLRDIEAGNVDCVVVYKVDRLSRSLLDFARMMQVFETHAVSFVSVTQLFNTASSMGRLVLNVLLSFAQFEREIIGERTRDKIAATRRKGKWTGGWPTLGYDVDPATRRLTVNPAEAERVRTIFDLYLKYGSLLPVVQDLAQRGWTTKTWQTKSGKPRGGGPFTRTNLYHALTNPLYIGQVRYKDEVHAGEHDAIVDAGTWQRVQATLARNGRSGEPRGASEALLQGLLRCTACDAAMTPSFTAKGNNRYRYYTCVAAQKKGFASCPTKAVPAHALEPVLVGQLQALAADPALQAEVLTQANRQAEERQQALDREATQVRRSLRPVQAELHRLAGTYATDEATLARLADLQDRLGAGEARLRAIAAELAELAAGSVSPVEATAALASFAPVWEALTTRERRRALHLAVEQVGYDGARGKLAIRFRPLGLRELGQAAPAMAETSSHPKGGRR
jgi:site-specific DNA recombinase